MEKASVLIQSLKFILKQDPIKVKDLFWDYKVEISS